jgi:uncharacterized protein YqgV (UPF0045/DUF77 family)
MRITAEISLYPLTENYEQVVIDFIQRLKRDTIRVEVNGLSTQLFGDYDEVMELLQVEAKSLFARQQAVLVMKIAAGDKELTKEALPAILK